jgi:hypothetical protein
MLIRYGCELSLILEQPTPAFFRVDIHPDRRGDIIEERVLQAGSALPLRIGYSFGNILQRCVLPAGETAIALAGLVRDDGLPDARDATALAQPVQDRHRIEVGRFQPFLLACLTALTRVSPIRVFARIGSANRDSNGLVGLTTFERRAG